MTSSLFLVAQVAAAQFSFVYNADQRQWTLRNGQVEAVFQLTPQGYFNFQRFTLLGNKDTWAASDEQRVAPFQLQVGDVFYDAYTSFNLVDQSVQEIPRKGYRQTIVLDDAQGMGRIELALEMYQGQPVLRTAVRFQNLQPAPVVVTAADMLPLLLADGGLTYQSFRVNQWAGGGVIANFEALTDTLGPDKWVTVHSGANTEQCTWLALRDQNNRGLFAGWEYDGRAWATLQDIPDQGFLQLSALVLDLNRPLDPQGQFVVPPSFIGAFHGDWDEAGYRTQRYIEAANAKPAPDSNFPYVMWNSWAYATNLDEATLRREAQLAASIGIEVFVVDWGWARQGGDWHYDPRKFPSGLRALSDYVHSLGMKFGVHFALLEAAPQAPVLLQNPDWASSVNNDYLGVSVSLCPSNRPFRDWIIGETVRMIDEYGLDWIVQDGENMVKDCTKSTHTHDPLDSNYANSVDGIAYIVDEVLRQRPALMWENCEDGGNMMTYSMTRRSTTSISSDNSDALTTRQAIFGATYPFPPRYTDRYMPDETLDTYATRSYMFGGPWIFMNRLTHMTRQDLDFAASEVKIYKALRAKISEGKVFHLTTAPALRRIDAIESYHPATDSAVVFVYRAGAVAASRLLRVRGLGAARNYTVRFENTGQQYVATGSELTTQGIQIQLPGSFSAEIVYINRL